MAFSVICNGCDVTPTPCTSNVRKSLGVSDDDFLFVFVGNINPNKNQFQVVDALKLLTLKGRNNIKCIFIGGGDVDSLKSKIKESNLSGITFVLGFIEKSDLPKYYSSADATILTSISEGFGLSIVEGYVYGKPNLTFGDLPAVKDLYNEEVMMLCPNRQTSTLAEYMEMMSQKDWDADVISQFAKRFSFERMASKYIDFYSETLSKE